MTILYKNMDSAQLLVKEEDVIKLILEFLSAEHYHVTLRALEKESNVLNCDYSEEVLFLRELVLDGDFTEVLDFGKSFSSNQAFNQNYFNYLVLRQKFIELIYKKLHLGTTNVENQDVDDVMKTLRNLESCCPSKEEYNNLCWLLTVPNLQSYEGFKNWKVDLSRLKLFDDLLNCLSDILPSIKKNKGNAKVSSNNRLLQLIVKGLFYESCVDYCQSVVSSLANEKKPVFSIRSQLLDNTNDGFPSNLLSWVSSLPKDVFNLPFEHTDVAISLSNIKEKPSVLYTSELNSSYDQLKFSDANDYIITEKKPSNIAERVLASKKQSSVTAMTINSNQNDNISKNRHYSTEDNLNNKNITENDIIPKTQNKTDPLKKSHTSLKENTNSFESSRLNNSTETSDVSSRTSITDDKQHSEQIREDKTQNSLKTSKSIDNKYNNIKISKSMDNKYNNIKISKSMDYKYNNKSSEQVKDISQQVKNDDKVIAQDKESQQSINKLKHHHTNQLLSTKNSLIGKDVTAPSVTSSISSQHALEEKVDRKDEVSAQSVAHKVDRRETQLLVNEKISKINTEQADNENKEKENNPDSKEVIYGPVINGVRRPISSFVLNNSSTYGEQNDISKPSKKSKPILQEKKAAAQQEKTPLKNENQYIEPEKTSADRNFHETLAEETIRNPKISEQNSLRQRDAIWRYKPMSMIEDSQAVRSVAFTPDGSLYAVGANSKVLRICMMAHPEQDESSDMLPRMSVMFKRNKYHRGSIYSMAWDPDGEVLATGSNDKSIKLLRFDATTFKQVDDETELNVHQGTVRELAFVPNRRGLLISGGAGDGCVHMSDIITQKSTGSFDGHTGNVLTVFAGNGDIVATGGTDNTLRLWDLRSQRCIDVVMVGDSSPASVSLSGDDKYLASGQEDGSILLYDLPAGRTLQNFRLHQSDCRSVRFSPNSARLLTASYDSTISILHVNKDLEMSIPNHYIIGKHNDKVIQARWHPTEEYLLSSSADRTAVLWSRD